MRILTRIITHAHCKHKYSAYILFVNSYSNSIMKMNLSGAGDPELIHYAESYSIDGFDYHYRLVKHI